MTSEYPPYLRIIRPIIPDPSAMATRMYHLFEEQFWSKREIMQLGLTRVYTEDLTPLRSEDFQLGDSDTFTEIITYSEDVDITNV